MFLFPLPRKQVGSAEPRFYCDRWKMLISLKNLEEICKKIEFKKTCKARMGCVDLKSQGFTKTKEPTLLLSIKQGSHWFCSRLPFSIPTSLYLSLKCHVSSGVIYFFWLEDCPLFKCKSPGGLNSSLLFLEKLGYEA